MSDNAVAITIAPVSFDDDHYIMIGFNTGIFSQAVNLPYKGVESARELGEQIKTAIIKSAEEILNEKFAVE